MYILTNKSSNILYTGVTNNLVRRCPEYKMKLIKGFTGKYNVDKRVYYEIFEYIDLVINREKQITGYSRQKKEFMINSVNPQRIDLYINGSIKNTYFSISATNDLDYLLVEAGIAKPIAKTEKENLFRFYPNPCHDYITVEYRTGEKEAALILEIKDAVGKTLVSRQLKGGNNDELIDVSILQPGVYTVYLYGDNMVLKTQKLTVIK